MMNFKELFSEWLKTFSSKVSFFSSKRLERFTFTSVVVGAYITLVVYEVIAGKFDAAEFTIASTPLLLAAGYNLSKTEQSKKENKDGEV